jgi:hypothetical protein
MAVRDGQLNRLASRPESAISNISLATGAAQFRGGL